MRATRAEIYLPHFYHNLASFRMPGAKLCLAVKGNAYGHGLLEMSRRAPVDCFAVATVEEGAILRKGGIRQPILLLSPHLRSEIPDICTYQLQPLISHIGFLSEYQRAAAARSQRQANLQGQVAARLRLHLKIDTGMCRAGAMPSEALPIAQSIMACDALELYGLCTHFASADSDSCQTQAQLECFRKVLRQFSQHNITIPCVHAANSVATLHYPQARWDMVRVGLGAYGYCPNCPTLQSTRRVRPVLHLKTQIGLVKKVARGAKVSYGGTWQAPRDSWLALLPVGYADGYPHRLSNKGQVLLQGKLCPVVGRVCMDQTVIDITDWLKQQAHSAPNQLLEQDVELLGSRLTAADIAEQIGSITYEVLTSISARVPRAYLE